MRTVLALLGIGILLGCRSRGWQAPESVMLKGFAVHSGGHCESSAMLNLLRHQGYGISEPQIIGAGSALGFMLDSSPFPFLGGRTMALKENVARTTGIAWHLGTQAEYGDGWGKIHELLKNGNPAVLRVDMRYLPYLYGGKYGPQYMSFGWHMICIAGMNAEKQSAYVTDTQHAELQEIKLADLHKARFSDTKTFPPNGEFYWADKAPSGFAFNWRRIAQESLRETERAMRETASDKDNLAGLDGLSKLPAALAGLDKRVPSYLLAPVLSFHYGCIETNGTGGAAFRRLYHAFLEGTGRSSGNAFIRGAAERLEPAVSAWTQLALGMKTLSENKAVLSNEGKRKEALAGLSQKAEEIYRAEKAFYEYIRAGG